VQICATVPRLGLRLGLGLELGSGSALGLVGIVNLELQTFGIADPNH